MVFDQNHPDFMHAKVVDQDGNDLIPEAIKSVDTSHHEYTRYEKDSSGNATGRLELVKVKKIEWCWHTKTFTITREEE